MESILANVLGGGLLVMAGCMFRWYHAVWRAAEAEAQSGPSPDPAEFRFFRGQFRRRMQMSAMLALVALGLLASQFVDTDAHPTLFVLMWLAMGLITAWVALLAVADLMAIRRHSLRLTTRLLMQQGGLQEEIRRLKGEQTREGNSNGHGEEGKDEGEGARD
jgi:hypothetical protein